MVYSMSGLEHILPDLNTGRQYHACASYVDIYDEKVNKTEGESTVAKNNLFFLIKGF